MGTMGISVRGCQKGLKDLASERIRGVLGPFCGLDNVLRLIWPYFGIRYDCGMVLFLSGSITVVEWPCLLLVFCEIIYAQQQT